MTTQVNLQLRRNPDYEDHAKLLGKTIADHEGYPRDNDGAWILTDESGNRAVTVAFRGKAKRGQAWNSPDPEGQAMANRIVESFNQYESLREALWRAVGALEKIEACGSIRVAEITAEAALPACRSALGEE